MGRPKLDAFNWCHWCGSTYHTARLTQSWPAKPRGFCCAGHRLASMVAGWTSMKPLPIVGDSASIEGSDFPAYLALRLEPLRYPWSTKPLACGFVRVQNSVTGCYFDVQGLEYADLVAERFNAIEYMRGVRP